MKNSLGLFFISLVVCAVLGVMRWREAKAIPDPDFTPLNQAIHSSFEVREGFGMGRFAGMIAHARRPVFSSPIARDAAKVLWEQGWEVNFYLGGRDLFRKEKLETSAATTYVELKDQTFRDLRGPVVMVPSENQNAPLRDAVVAQAKTAFLANMSQGYRSQVGEWRLLSYPVKATKASCVGCHQNPEARRQLGRPLKIGDTLGVTIYVYRRARAA